VKVFILQTVLAVKQLYQQEQSKCYLIIFNTSSINVLTLIGDDDPALETINAACNNLH